jgi:ligand-binding sensor domain-containing protein/signal transduction histidine kinase
MRLFTLKIVRLVYRLVGAITCLLLCTTLLRLSAQQTTHAASYTRTLWRVPDGLPEETVQALTEGNDGALWIGTTGGLAKTGGLTIRARDIGFDKPLEANSVSALASSRDGTLWIGTEGSGMLHLVRRELTKFSVPQGLSNGFVRSIFEDRKNQLWVGTDRGLFKLQDKHLTRVDGIGSTPEIAVRAMAEDSSGNLWLGGSRLLSIDPKGEVTQYLSPKANGEDLVEVILPTPDGQMWVGMVGGLARFDRGHLRKLPRLRATVRSLLQTRDGTLWIGTVGDGLWTFRTGRLTKVENPGMLPSETVLSLLQDRFGQIWVGTQAGLVRIEKSPVDLIPLPEATDHGYETISGDSAGNLWIAAQKLYRLQDGKMQQVTYGLPNVGVRCVYQTRDGAFWIGTDGSGVYRMRNGESQHYTAPEQLTSNFIRGFLEDKGGDLWVGTEDGLNVIGGQGVRKLTERSGLSYFSTRGLLEARDGAIWIGTDRGMSIWKDGRFIQNLATEALAGEKVWSLLQDRQGTFWFGTREHGIFRLRNGAVEHFTTERGLPTNSIYKILQDRRGRFWISGPNIIFSVQEDEMEVPSAAGSTLSPLIYALPSGGVQMYGGVEPAGYLSGDDSVWFPSSRGAAHVVADGLNTAASAPQVVIFEIFEDGRSLSIHGHTQFPASSLRMSFRLSANYLRPQQALRFRYKLEGFEDAWIQARAEDVASYTNLRPGRYRFRVQVADLAVPGSTTETVLEIDKAPLFYQTKMFYGFCSLALGWTGWISYRLRLRQMRARFRAVLDERARLAREMHDTVIQSCTGISSLLEAAESTASTDHAKHQKLLMYARDLTTTTISQARQAVWAMRHGPEINFDFIEILHAIAIQTMRDQTSIAVNIESANKLILPNSIAHELGMIVREAVYNAVQHSGTPTITLVAHMLNGAITIEVVDCGFGMLCSEQQIPQTGHYGLIGMRERMKRIGGQLEVHSVPGDGTTVRLLLANVDHFKVGEKV